MGYSRKFEVEISKQKFWRISNLYKRKKNEMKRKEKYNWRHYVLYEKKSIPSTRFNYDRTVLGYINKNKLGKKNKNKTASPNFVWFIHQTDKQQVFLLQFANLFTNLKLIGILHYFSNMFFVHHHKLEPCCWKRFSFH